MNAHSKLSFGDRGDWILNSIKRNPEGLLLLAAGAVLMMRSSSFRSVDSDVADEPASNLGDTVSGSARRTLQEAASYASTASEGAHEAMETAKSYASSTADYAGQARRKVEEQSDRVVRQTKAMAQSVLQNQPLAIVAAGLAAGAALAAAFPATEIETEALEPVNAAAGRFGEQVKRATARAGEKLKSAADERGLHAEGFKEVAGEVVDAFKETLSGQQEETHTRSSAGQPDGVPRSGR
jgi:ElaB/YqjD/DUF883 family membrane-anchored ribosome-binding protein